MASVLIMYQIFKWSIEDFIIVILCSVLYVSLGIVMRCELVLARGNAIYIYIIITPPRNQWGVIFSLQFVCLCVSVCVCDSPCEQNSSRTDASIYTRFSLNVCFTHWLEPNWNWWLWVTVAKNPFFLHNSLSTSLMRISTLLCLIKIKYVMPLKYASGKFIV